MELYELFSLIRLFFNFDMLFLEGTSTIQIRPYFLPINRLNINKLKKGGYENRSICFQTLLKISIDPQSSFFPLLVPAVY